MREIISSLDKRIIWEYYGLMNDLITIRTLAKKLSLAAKTIRRYEKHGLPVHILGNQKNRRYEYEEVLKWLEQQKNLSSMKEVKKHAK